jgi:four helix bundle protein
MDAADFKQRTRDFANRVINLAESLPSTRAAAVVAHQIIKFGTSVAANYRAACRARSPADFRSKMGIVEEEADETAFWLELISDRGYVRSARLAPLLKEANEIISMVVASIRISHRKSQRRTNSANPQSAICNPQFP